MTQFIVTLPDGSTNTIVANEAFVEANYPGAWELVPAPPPIDVAEPTDARITRLAFRNRFTQAEKVTLELAALDNPAASTAQRQQTAALRSYLKDLDAAAFVDLGHPGTVAGVQSLGAAGLLAEGRAAAILTAPIEAHERPLP